MTLHSFKIPKLLKLATRSSSNKACRIFYDHILPANKSQD